MKQNLETARATARQAVANFDTAAKILRTICQVYRVTLADLGNGRRHRRVTWPRQLAIYYIRQRTTYNLNQIGALFGCYASNVLQSIKSVECELETSCAAGRELASLASALPSANAAGERLPDKNV